MKANNRIKTEFIINTIISSVLFIIGVLSIIGGTIAFSEIANETQDITDNALSLIFLEYMPGAAAYALTSAAGNHLSVLFCCYSLSQFSCGVWILAKTAVSD